MEGHQNSLYAVRRIKKTITTLALPNTHVNIRVGLCQYRAWRQNLLWVPNV